MSNEYKLSQVASNEMKNFALYTIESRAIPNLIDGLKPVQRFYLYSSLMNTPKDYKKVSAVAGVISDYGYNHGEASAAGAGQLMAATWNNNICLVEGRGSFGTRLIQEAGAPRYVYTRTHSNFNKYIKDISLSPVHEDPEHEPPAFYIPSIPLVLSNGAKGIATGFATNILPRGEKALIKACKEYIKTGKIKARLPVEFPDFKGTTEYDSITDRYVCKGVFERPTATRLLITEVPYGYDREAYIKVLDKLEDDGLLVSYDDECSSEGFRFDIKLRNSTAKDLRTDEKVLKLFKLEKTHSENITTIDENGDLKIFDDERDVVKHFVDYRLGILTKRIENEISKYKEEARWLQVKAEFIQGVLEDKITFKGKKKEQVEALVLEHTSALDTDTDKLLRMNMLSLTIEQIKELMAKIKESKEQLKFWESTTEQDQFLYDLESL